MGVRTTDGSDTRNQPGLVSGFGSKYYGEMGLSKARQVELGFPSFLAKFLAYLMIFQSGTC